MDSITTIQPDLLVLTAAQAEVLMPYFWVIVGTIITLLACVLPGGVNPKWPVFILAATTAILGMVSSFQLLGSPSLDLFNNMMVADNFANTFYILFLGSALFTIFVSFRYLDNEGLQHPEYYVLILFSTIGMMLMASAKDLIVLFIALELMSLAIYTLVGFRRADRRSNEASMKYFILGGAASAILLYGAALLYGATASTNIQDILEFSRANAEALPGIFTLGAWLLITGFLFKVASVPFHMWMPDVYEGAPAPITGFMTTGLKAASFAAFIRVFASLGVGSGLTEMVESNIHDILWVCAVLTMVLGNVIALTQTNLKRMLAFSSIAHTGYLLVGMLAAPASPQGYAPVLVYLVGYSLMNLGAFVVLTILANRGDEGLNLHDLSGLVRRRPWLAFAMAIFMFSMAGIPPTAGFMAKYLLFYSAIQAQEIFLVVISVLCSAISVYYYLRVLVYMYMRDPVGVAPNSRVSLWSAIAVACMAILTVEVGLLPAPLVEAARQAVTGF